MIIVNARFLTQPLSGVQRYAYEIARHLKRIDPAIIFVCPTNILHLEWARALEVKVIGRLKGHLWEQMELPAYLYSVKNPVLFSPCNVGPVFYRRQILTVHDLAFLLFPFFNSFWFRSFYTFLIPKLCHRARHIFTVSETIRQQLCVQYAINPAKVSVTYNGVAEDMQLSPGTKLQKEKIILTVGSLNARKNIDFLIRGFLASRLYPEYSLIIIGNRNAIYRFQPGKLAAGVQIINDVSDRVVKDYYANAEIACFLSLYEGFGIPVLESLQYGCKVLCSDIPAFRELYEGYVTFCDPYDDEMLTRKLDEMPGQALLTPAQLSTLDKRFEYRQSAELVYEMLRKI